MPDPTIKKPLRDLTKLMLDEWVHRMIKRNKLSKTEYYTMSMIIRQALEYAKDKGDIDKNVFSEVKVDTKMFRKTQKKSDETQVYLEDEQVNVIKEAWKEYKTNPHNTTPLAVILAFYIGTRPGETIAIKETDIKGQYVHIQQMEVGEFETEDGINYKRVSLDVIEHTKTDAGDREAFAPTPAMEVIRLARTANAEQENSGGYLFLDCNGERIKESAVNWRLKKYCNHLGIPFRSPHKMRKTYISTLIDSNVNINTIRKQVGHEDEKTTYQCYCFDRKNDKQIENQLEEALKLNIETSNILEFKSPFYSHMDEVTRGNQNQVM